jgi:perosamine synthetase
MTLGSFIPVCEPTLQGNELKYANEALKSGWISSAGKYISLFEEKFASFCGVEHGISCSNGTTALHLAIAALGIGKGDEVIVPSFTMAASSNAVIYTGAKPVFVDSELDTWNMDVSKVEEKITDKTKAVMVVHTYGHPINMDALRIITQKYNIPIIEDAAEAHGAEYMGRKAGSLGDIACFSFYANKIITTGEGGMVVTNNSELAEKCRKLRNHYFGNEQEGVPRFQHHEVGFNYRMTNIQAAIGLAQVERIGQLVDARRKNAKLYNSLLKDIPGIVLPPEKSWAKNVYWMYGILVREEFGMSMSQLRAKLLDEGIDSRSFFIGMHKQPMYSQGEHQYSCPCPVAEDLEQSGLYLPSTSHLTEAQITFICNKIKEYGK